MTLDIYGGSMQSKELRRKRQRNAVCDTDYLELEVQRLENIAVELDKTNAAVERSLETQPKNGGCHWTKPTVETHNAGRGIADRMAESRSEVLVEYRGKLLRIIEDAHPYRYGCHCFVCVAIRREAIEN